MFIPCLKFFEWTYLLLFFFENNRECPFLLICRMEALISSCPEHFNMAHLPKRILILTCRNVSASYSIGNLLLIRKTNRLIDFYFYADDLNALCCACRHHTLNRENHGKRNPNELLTNISIDRQTPKRDMRIFHLLRERIRNKILGYSYIQAQAKLNYKSVAQSLDRICEDVVPCETWSFLP